MTTGNNEDQAIFKQNWEDGKLRGNIRALVRLSLNRESHVNMVQGNEGTNL